MSRIIVESHDLLEWGEELISLGQAVVDHDPSMKSASHDIKNIGICLRATASIAPLAPEESE